MDRLASMSSFVQVVDTRSFSGAARQLKLSQATVTGHIQSLEQQLGIRLLNRTTRKVSLTEEGAQFYQRCMRILAEFTEVENLAKSFQQAPRGRLRLNTDVTLARVVAPVVSEYVLSYPEVSVELIMTDQISDLVEGKFDLAIHAGSAFDSSLIQRVLGKAQRVVCASPIYLALRGTPRIPRISRSTTASPSAIPVARIAGVSPAERATTRSRSREICAATASRPSEQRR